MVWTLGCRSSERRVREAGLGTWETVSEGRRVQAGRRSVSGERGPGQPEPQLRACLRPRIQALAASH